jgi:trans-aconitate methyltransferase
MFSKSAHLYDILYSFKDYPAESQKIIDLIQNEMPGAQTLLDVACGTAEHDKYLSQKYQVDGLDLDPEFVRLAAEKNPQCSYFHADMRGFDLGKTYDVIQCLFSSIGYIKTLDIVVKALACFKRHLNRDGIILVEPWFTPDVWQVGSMHMLSAETDDLKVCRMNTSEREGDTSIIDFHYMVGSEGKIDHFTERHELGLFTVDQMMSAFSDAELNVRYDPEGLTGRGLYIARIPNEGQASD